MGLFHVHEPLGGDSADVVAEDPAHAARIVRKQLDLPGLSFQVYPQASVTYVHLYRFESDDEERAWILEFGTETERAGLQEKDDEEGS